MIEQEQTIEVETNIYPNEIDPTVPQHVKEITEENIKQWNSAKTEVTANDVKFEDGTTFQEKYDSGELKGEPGEKGATGEQGLQGIPGADGKDGYTPIKGVDYFDGSPGQDGADGIDGITPTIGANGNWFLGNVDTGKPSQGTNGINGTDGYTPVKGTDYFTEADKQELVNLVLAEIPSAEGVGY